MCRFVCYRGPEILLADLLYKPTNSLIRQSFHAKERTEPLNGDGFGVGWYAPQISSTPCVFASLTPAWSNQNLRQISEHVKSGCFFAHVRAASPGMPVSEANYHPFQYGRFLWMHNGGIRDFWRIKLHPITFLTIESDLTVNVELMDVARIGSRVSTQPAITLNHASVPRNLIY